MAQLFTEVQQAYRGPGEVLDFHLAERINGGPSILGYPVGGDTLAFIDFALRGMFEPDVADRVTGLPPSNCWAGLRRQGRVAVPVAGYRTLKLSE